MRKYILSGVGALTLVLLMGAQVQAADYEFLSIAKSRIHNRVKVMSNTGHNTQNATGNMTQQDDAGWGRIWSRNELASGGAGAAGDITNDINGGEEVMPDDDDQEAKYYRRSTLSNKLKVKANSGYNTQGAHGTFNANDDDNAGGEVASHNSMMTGNAEAIGTVLNVVNARYSMVQ